MHNLDKAIILIASDTSALYSNRLSSGPIGRFAPTPSGKLHLGNAFSFLVAMISVRRRGGFMKMRIEDLDSTRCKPEFIDALFRDFEWLQFEWCGEVLYQSDRTEAYEQAFRTLSDKGIVYPCFCSRADLHAASAPHVGEELIYPGTCRELSPIQRKEKELLKKPSYRVMVEEKHYTFTDLFQGDCSFDLPKCSGDFIVRRSDGIFAYQLAVVIDDEFMNVDSVIRGVDLLSSVPRQRFLQSILGYHQPHYGHVSILTDENGRRLAKRSGDISIEFFRTETSYTPSQILGLLAYSSNMIPDYQPCTVDELIKHADLDQLRNIRSFQLNERCLHRT